MFLLHLAKVMKKILQGGRRMALLAGNKVGFVGSPIYRTLPTCLFIFAVILQFKWFHVQRAIPEDWLLSVFVGLPHYVMIQALFLVVFWE